MPTILEIEKFIELAQEHPVIDVRTPSENEYGKFPGAFNIPIMDNVERSIVGTIYKQAGKQPAILKGLEFAGPRLKDLIKKAKKIPNKNIFLVHCWRGGMRSGFFAWLLEFYGFEVYILKGGYKAFRARIHEEYKKNFNLKIIGGKTGSGKTMVLHELKKSGEQIIDLEDLAHHKGSSFGALGQMAPPSQEMFENLLGIELMRMNPEKRIWIEDEGRTIGNKVIPADIWKQMRDSQLYFLEIPFEQRLDYIISDYGKFPVDELIKATERIQKRIGPEQCKLAIEALLKNDLKTGFGYSLAYYDKAYLHNFNLREIKNYITLNFNTTNPAQIAATLLSSAE